MELPRFTVAVGILEMLPKEWLLLLVRLALSVKLTVWENVFDPVGQVKVVVAVGIAVTLLVRVM